MVYSQGIRDAFVDRVCRDGVVPAVAGAVFGLSSGLVSLWSQQAVGMSKREVRELSQDEPWEEERGGRALTYPERMLIQVGLRTERTQAWIARELGRDPSVISRELQRNTSDDGRYYATRAHLAARRRRKRPKTPLLARPGSDRLRVFIETAMDDGWSPKLIADMLTRDPDAMMGRVSHETIYRALYVQTRGLLRQDLHRQLSTGRASRKARDGSGRRDPSPYTDAFRISDRPAEAADRAVPGHWEGDLILGAGNRSAIGTLVERATRYTILLHLPGDHGADTVANAMIEQMQRLPEQLRRSITWDRGTELADWRRIQTDLVTTLYFADPRSPWQRGTNENTNRLLRHWFKKRSDLSAHGPYDLARIAATLNDRPRPTLDYDTPAQRMTRLLIASTP